MKNLKKKLAGFLVFAMVLGIMAPSATVVVKAASAAPTVKADFEAEEVELTCPDATKVEYVLYKGTASASGAALTTDKEIKDTAWEYVDASNGGKVDISWVQKKESKLIFRFTYEDEKNPYQYAVLDIKNQETTLKAGLATTAAGIDVKGTGIKAGNDFVGMTVGDSETGFLYFYTGKGNDAKLVSPSSIQWKKGVNGAWTEVTGATPLTAAVLTKFKAKGATLYFRIKADETSWASKEVKFSYKKQANAPNVKVDVSKHTITLKDTYEYSLDAGLNWLKVSDLATIDTDHYSKTALKTLRVEDMASVVVGNEVTQRVGENDLYADIVEIHVRVAANATKGTIPSKTKVLNIKTVSKGAVEFGDEIKVAYTVGYDKSSGITISNYSNIDCEFTYVASGTSIDATTKWKSLKAAKSAEKPGTGKISANKSKTVYDDNTIIYVRVAGDKKKGELADKPVSFKVSAIVPTVQSCTKASISGDGFTNCVLTPATEKTNAVVSVSVSAVTGKTIDGKLSMTFENITKATSAKVEAKNAVDGVTVPTSLKIDSTSKTGTLEIKVDGTKVTSNKVATYTITIEGLTVELVLDITGAK